MLIAVPTKNHDKHIMYFLAKILDDAKQNGFDIGIYDASDNDSTELVVREKINSGYKNLFFKKYDENTNLEDRCEDIYTNMEYEYIWLCGDGTIPNITKSFSLLDTEMKKEKDIIVFGKDFSKEYKEYKDSVEFCKECFVWTTWFGAVVLKGGLISRELFSRCKEKYFEQAVPGVYYELFKSGEINATYVTNLFYDSNPYKKQSIATKEGRNIYAFAQLFTNTINRFPQIYDPIKKDIYKVIADVTGLYKIEHLWWMRVDHNLNWKIWRNNLKYIKIASNTSWIIMGIIALCPICLAKKIALIEDDIW